jgi:sugar/nucleoside kinase (ribokinase family)
LHGAAWRPASRESGEAVDSTGAGDSSRGFLYGLIRGLRLDDCGRLANRIAARVVAQEGCRVDLLDRSEILSVLDR